VHDVEMRDAEMRRDRSLARAPPEDEINVLRFASLEDDLLLGTGEDLYDVTR
jgi:hypothetical protein